MRAVDAEDYKSYMLDSIHHTKLGYEKWWGPKFIHAIDKVFYE